MTNRRRLLTLAPLLTAAAILLLWQPEIYVVAIVHVLAVPAVLYPLVYRDVRWRDGATGKALMNKALSLALLIVVSITGFWWPFPGYEYIYGAALTYLTVAVTYQFLVMKRLRRAGIDHRAAEART